jgi:hypothetical protein
VKDAYVDAQLTCAERDVVRNLAAPCDLVLSGDGQEGDNCDENSECDREAGLECLKKLDELQGTCQTPKTIRGGLSCAAPDQVCEEGFYCNDERDCLGRQDAAETCSAIEPCAQGLKCSEVPDGGVGHCIAKLESGDEGCEVDSDCKTGICAAGEGDDPNVCARNILLDAPKAICKDFR